MSANAATVAVGLALALGFYGARVIRAGQDAQRARDTADAAGRNLWRARGIIIAVGLAVAAALDFWLGGHGR